MKLRGRVHKLETKSQFRPTEPTREDAILWTRRFIAADPAHAEIFGEIRAWGAKHHINYIYADCTGEIHAGEFMMAVFYTLVNPVYNRSYVPRTGYGEGIPLLRRFAPLLHKYMRMTGDVFPLKNHWVDSLAGEDGAEFLEMCMLLCDAAKERAKDEGKVPVLNDSTPAKDRNWM